MKFPLKTFEVRVFRGIFRRDPSGKLLTFTLRLGTMLVSSIVLSSLFSGGLRVLLHVIAETCFACLVVCLFALFSRWLFIRVFWTVRSRLIIIGLLMGVAPVVLFTTLGSVAAYVFCGQFATSIATERIDDELGRLQAHSAAAAFLKTQATVNLHGAPKTTPAPATSSQGAGAPGEMVIRYSDGVRTATPQNPSTAAVNTVYFSEPTLPPWVHPGFKGVVEEGGKLFLCGSDGAADAGHQLLVLTCKAFSNEEVETIAEGIGSIRIADSLLSDNSPDVHEQEKEEGKQEVTLPVEGKASQKQSQEEDADPTPTPPPTSTTKSSPSNLPPSINKADPTRKGPPALEVSRNRRASSDNVEEISGGTLSPALNTFDLRVYFSAPLAATMWVSGEDANTWLFVISRPVVLYKRLFASSVRTGTFVRIALVATGSVFAVLELLACLMAIILSRTITRSIADLYHATRQIDNGNLDHRIPVRRKDQLAVLAASFNTMTGSLKGLLAQQREKDRMESELKVAQEVQNNLFPHSEIALPDFELFGICQPARTVGGDYYDFIPFGTSQLYLALGDISGKGISAALLMASLHSAVRAYRSSADPETVASDLIARNDLNMSPARLLGLLNAHLLSSTQSSKYATLFLACYDSSTRKLTYSNGGHLPPILLSANGEVKRLTCGGSVVGLLQIAEYQEETVQLNRGDLLVIYSDGLTEPEKDTIEYGEDRLVDVIRRNKILTLPDIASRAIAEVHAWIGNGEQPDDITLVLARLT